MTTRPSSVGDMSPVPRRLAALAALAAAAAHAAVSNVSNIEPRRDGSGAIIDAHDGDVVFDAASQRWLYFAAGYGECIEPPGLNGCADWCNDCGCGFFYNHSVNVFSTTDFVAWTAHGNVLPLGAPRPNATLFSPKAIFNNRTQLWVLWYNLSPPYNYAVATSPSPFGPFVTVNTTVALSTQWGHYYNNSNVGDFALFVDDDGAAYIHYSANAHAQIERLTDDYLASTWATTGATSGTLPHGNEAPAMFKRRGLYYALVSDSCCYCGGGGTVRAFVAQSPLGPYTYTGSITDGANPFNPSHVTTASQQTVAFAVGDQIVWVGDRWQSAPDRLKAHDFTSLYVIDFDANGTELPIAWRDSVLINV